MKIDQFLPNPKNKISLEEVCSNKFFEQNAGQPFQEESLNFLNEVSRLTFLDTNIKKFPELAALSYWIRRGSISSIIEDYKKRIFSNEVIVPRGVVLHIAPSNVDSIFMYSWALSLLAGNINIIRISRNHSTQITFLLQIIQKALKDKRFIKIAKRNRVITYSHDDDINAKLSELADVRVIWGGNETVDYFRSLPSSRTTKDIVFADKWSHSVIDSAKYNELSNIKKKDLSKLFFNDSYWFDQMACSSPRIVFFVGKKRECIKASKSFWMGLNMELEDNNSSEDIGTAMNKLVYLYERAKTSNKVTIPYRPENGKALVINLDKIDRNTLTEQCGGGLFLATYVKDLSQLSPIIQQNDQTLSYFGFDKSTLFNFISGLNGNGLDRVVPIGSALNFSPVWDGYDLLTELTKRVQILN